MLILSILFSLFFIACGEVSGGYELSSSSENAHSGSSSSLSSASSSSGVFEINMNWRDAPVSSYVHGTVSVYIDPYRVSEYLITQGQYKQVMGVNPSKGIKNDDLPVEGVTWFKAVEFCKKLSLLLGLDENAVRLPTEAEWETVACSSIEYSGCTMSVIQRNFEYWEWTNDCFGDFPYGTNNPSGPPNCLPREYKVRKGLTHTADERYATDPELDNISNGHISFRVVVKK